MENYFHREFSPVTDDHDMWIDDHDYVGEHGDDDDGNESDHFHYMEEESRREEGVFSSYVTTSMVTPSSPMSTPGLCEYNNVNELLPQTFLHMQQPELAMPSGSGNSQIQALKLMSVGTILALSDKELAQKMERAKCNCRACRQPCKADVASSQCASCLLDKYHPGVVVCPLLGECQAVRSRGESTRDDRQNRGFGSFTYCSAFRECSGL